jgi:cytidylate kinase
LRSRGEIVDTARLLAEIMDRDARDKGRVMGALRIPEGAETIDTTDLSEDQVVDQIVVRAMANTHPTLR